MVSKPGTRHFGHDAAFPFNKDGSVGPESGDIDAPDLDGERVDLDVPEHGAIDEVGANKRIVVGERELTENADTKSV
jgi:hypothetical protein